MCGIWRGTSWHDAGARSRAAPRIATHRTDNRSLRDPDLLTGADRVDPDRVWQSSRAVEYLPHHPTLANYQALFVAVPFANYFRNSAIIALGTMTLALT